MPVARRGGTLHRYPTAPRCRRPPSAAGASTPARPAEPGFGRWDVDRFGMPAYRSSPAARTTIAAICRELARTRGGRAVERRGRGVPPRPRGGLRRPDPHPGAARPGPGRQPVQPPVDQAPIDPDGTFARYATAPLTRDTDVIGIPAASTSTSPGIVHRFPAGHRIAPVIAGGNAVAGPVSVRTDPAQPGVQHRPIAPEGSYDAPVPATVPAAACTSARTFTAHVERRHRGRLRHAVVRVDGKVVDRLRRGRSAFRVDLRHPPLPRVASVGPLGVRRSSPAGRPPMHRLCAS